MRFAEVLKEKMKDKTLDESRVRSTGPHAVSPAGPVPLHPEGLFSREEWRPLLSPYPRNAGAYRATDRSATRQNPPQTKVTPIQEPLLQVQELSTSERDGLQFLILNGASGFSETFTRSHLRKEYRRLVKRFHPDSHHAQGTQAVASASSQFLKLQEARQKLARLF
ncbi:MAG: J domain-containing protein [Bdellovibrionales bacterium]|nr:J domain-containing protein [Bdellovibrionales bacterium]